METQCTPTSTTLKSTENCQGTLNVEQNYCNLSNEHLLKSINPLKVRGVNWLHFAIHTGLTYIFNFWHSGTLAFRTERQSARMSEIKNGRLDLDAIEHF